MKKLIAAFLITVTTLTSSGVFAADQEIQLSPALSAALVSDLYAKRLAGLKKNTATIGKSLIMTGMSTLQLEPNEKTYAYFHFSITSATTSPEHIGSLVAVVDSLQGRMFVESVYFSPVATPPGGVSVGN